MTLFVKNSDGSLSKEVTSQIYRDDAWLFKDTSILCKDTYINKVIISIDHIDIINQEMLSENTNGIYYVMTLSKDLITAMEEDN